MVGSNSFIHFAQNSNFTVPSPVCQLVCFCVCICLCLCMQKQILFLDNESWGNWKRETVSPSFSVHNNSTSLSNLYSIWSNPFLKETSSFTGNITKSFQSYPVKPILIFMLLLSSSYQNFFFEFLLYRKGHRQKTEFGIVV